MSLRQILIAKILFAFFLFFFFLTTEPSYWHHFTEFLKEGGEGERWRDCVKFLLMHNAFKHRSCWIDATNQLRNDS